MWKKFLLLSLALTLALGTYFWIEKDRWLAEFNQQRAEESAEFRAAGFEYGQQHDQQACLDRALQEFNTECSGFSCTVRYGQFLNACWEQAAPTEGFCEGVPPFQETPSEEDKNWARHTCWGQDIRGEGCRLLLRQQQQLCSQASSIDS